MIIGFSAPRSNTYPPEWMPPQQRHDVGSVRCNLHYIRDHDWEFIHQDVPVHFENHSRILGRLTREQEHEDIIELIPEGEARARSLLEKLIKPFISSFNNASIFPGYMRKFCDKLIPVDNTSCCIDARTRQAFDYALAEDMSTPTFSEFLNDAINCCPEDKSDSYFYILAYLMRHHWNKAYRKDLGTNGICKTDGELSSDSLELIIQGIEQTVLELNCTKDFLYAYDLVPKELQEEYLSLISEQEDYFKSFAFLSEDKDVVQFSKLLKEQDIGLRYFFHILSQHLESENFIISSTLLKNLIAAVPKEFICKIFSMNFRVKANTDSKGLANELQNLLSKLSDEEVSSLFERIPRRKIKDLSLFSDLYSNAVTEHLAKSCSPFFDFLLKVEPNLLISNPYGITPLMAAALTGNTSGVKLLLESRLDIQLNAHQPKYGLTALHYAVSYEFSEIVKLLLESPYSKDTINHNPLDNDYQTPLYLAAEDGNSEIIQILLDSGKVDINAAQSPLFIAVRNSHKEAARQLLKAGADVNVGYPILNESNEGQNGRACLRKYAYTVLEIAINARDYALVELLLEYSAKPYERAVSHPNVSLAYVTCCRRWAVDDEVPLEHLEQFLKMDATIYRLLKKAEFYANSVARTELYQLYDNYIANVDFIILNNKLSAIEDNINAAHAKSAALHCPATRGSRVYFIGAEELRFSTEIIRKGNQAFFKPVVLSHEKAYDMATSSSKKIIRQGNMHCFKDITPY